MPDQHDEPGVTPEAAEPDPRLAEDDRSPERLHRALQSEREAKKAADDGRKKAEKERAELARRLSDYEEAEEQRKNGELSEMERLKKVVGDHGRKAAEAEQRAAQAEARLIDTKIAHAVEREASAARFLYPDVAPSLVDRSLVEFDPDSGEVRGAKKAVEKLLKDKPGLAEAYSGGGTPGRTGPRQPAYGARGDGAVGPAPSRPQPQTPYEELISLGGYGV